MYSFTIIFYSVNNCVHNCKNQPHQEVEGGYTFVNVLVKKYDYFINRFYGILLIKGPVIIAPTGIP